MDQLVERFEQSGLLVDRRPVPTAGARWRSDGSIPARTSATALATVDELIAEASTTRA